MTRLAATPADWISAAFTTMSAARYQVLFVSKWTGCALEGSMALLSTIAAYETALGRGLPHASVHRNVQQ